MTTEMITLKLEDSFLGEIDKVVQKEGYQSRTEFIRNALREKIEETKMKEAMLQIAHLRGSARKKTTEEEYELVRQKSFDEIAKKFK